MKLPVLLAILFFIQQSTSNTPPDPLAIPSTCSGLADGKYSMKLLSGEYPILTDVQCSNEYMIIDYSADNSWSSYFSTWQKYHYAVAASSRNDHSNWKQWFTPSNVFKRGKVNFLLSPECQACDASQTKLQTFNEFSTYYMSALAFGCFNPTRGWPACDMDFSTYECKICEWNNDKSQISSRLRTSETLEEVAAASESAGVCDFEVRSSMQPILREYKECQTLGSNGFKPSLGLAGKFCVCAKFDRQRYLPVSDTDLQNAVQTKQDIKSVEVTDKTSINNYVKLYQKQFQFGTYRITEPGTYEIMEDIVFDFNAGTISDPLKNDAWWPTVKQNEKYDGAGGVRGAYFLGFFAGITIETDDVILNLNGHTLEMSKPFFYTQPFFSIIELSSQTFLPQQGPGFFGSDPQFATNVVITNGVLGLSSHHAIHGNYNKHIVIKNVKIRDFQTHGIQLNGFTDITLEDVDVGPTTDIAVLNGNFGQLREILPTLRKIAIANPDSTITFANRNEAVTMQDILDELEPLMVKAFNYAAYDIDSFKDDKDWALVKEYFINPSGLPYGAVTYGLFFNYPSAGIFGWHVNDATSDTLTLKNVKIHGLRHKGNEILGLARRGRVFCNAFNGPLSLVSLLGNEKAEEWSSNLIDAYSSTTLYGQYSGDIISDTWLAMYYFGRSDFDNWPGIPFVGDNEELLEWAMDSSSTFMSSDRDENDFDTYCNEDAMFHPAKGLLAIKISGTKNVMLDNVEIYDIRDTTPLGITLCGAKDLYHFSQQRPYQIGFSMNMIHGITVDYSTIRMTNINIRDLYSSTGLVFGIAAWFDTHLKFGTNIHLSELHAGITVEKGDYSYSDRPNKAPEVCSIHFVDNEEYQISVSFEDADEFNAHSISQTCMSGSIGCLGVDGVFTAVGQLKNSEECAGDMNDVDSDIRSGVKLVPHPKPRPGEGDRNLNKKQDTIFSELGVETMISGGWIVKTLTLAYESPIAYVVVFLLAGMLLFCVKKIYHVPEHVKHARALKNRMGHYGGDSQCSADDYGTF